MGTLKRSLTKLEIKQIHRMIEEIKNNIVLVEGKKDVIALRTLGINAIPIAHNPRKIARALIKHVDASKKIIILTDLDHNGKRMAHEVEEEVVPYYKCDTQIRRMIAHLLSFRCFEEFQKRYEDFVKINGGEYHG